MLEKTLFMSSSIETLPILISLQEKAKEVALFTVGDSREGRGQKRAISKLKQEAIKKNIQVFQGNSFAAESTVRLIKSFRPEIILTADFSLFLPEEILKIPLHGCLNIHPSLLPKYRGPSPIIEAILKGESFTGITIFLMSQIIDGGKILFQKKLPIEPQDTAQGLKKKLFKEISKDLIKVILNWKNKKTKPSLQKEKEANYTKKYLKKDGEIDWNMTAQNIERRIRAFCPWPGTWTSWEGKKVKILKARPLVLEKTGKEGCVFLIKNSKKPKIGVFCGTNALEIQELQLEGKKALLAEDFMRGRPDFLGAVLGKQ